MKFIKATKCVVCRAATEGMCAKNNKGRCVRCVLKAGDKVRPFLSSVLWLRHERVERKYDDDKPTDD